MYCVDFAENALFSSFRVINFAEAKLLDFRHSTFYLYVKSCMSGTYMVGLREYLTIRDLYIITLY